jgi:hypothetical protein
MSPRRGSKPRHTDRLVVSRNVTLTLTIVVVVEEGRKIGRPARKKEDSLRFRR